MAILNNSNAISPSGYDVNNSVRLRNSASAYLNRTPSSATNRKTWTWSGWVKNSRISAYSPLFYADAGGNTNIQIQFLDDNTLRLFQQFSGVDSFFLVTTQVFRDPSAWYHIVVAVDTTQATSSNRAKMYINGQQVTAFSSATYPSLNLDSTINSTVAHYVGYAPAGPYYFDGYLAEVHFIDGSAKTPSDFGETDTTTGVWKPKAYTGTYGTNGFYLKFSDIATTSGSNAGLGKDFSGNTNYWTTNNISVTSGTTYDAMKDSPTNTSATVANYCVFSPLWTGSPTLSNGNLQITSATTSQTAIGSMAANSGKFYFEYQYTSSPATNGGGGVWDINSAFSAGGVPDSGTGARYIPTNGNILKFINGSSTTVGTYATYTSGDIIGVGFDCDAGTVSFYKNNTLQVTITDSNFISKFFAPCMYVYTGNVAANFGQRPFAYTPPSGFVALNTFNLPTPTILQGNRFMDATLYTGNNKTAQTINNSGLMRSDLLWIKGRSYADQHVLFDSIRGVSNRLFSSATNAEASNSTLVTSFNSNGFSLGTDTAEQVNFGTNTYVAWQWQAGQGSTSSNTSGSITSTVSVNTTAGFSIVTYTGTGANATVGHGLGVAPRMIIVKGRSIAESWRVGHNSVNNGSSPWNYYMGLNLTNAAAAASTVWNNTAPTSTVFSIGTDSAMNSNTNTYVAYCWAEIAGFSRFGSYTGNGSTNGPFVYLGFRPEFLMIKRTDGVSGRWIMEDTSRDPTNVADKHLAANLTNVEGTGTWFTDFLSNGFKIRNSDSEANASGGTYIYMAFAESPFSTNNRAR
jgi:hypothetical protein